MDTQCKLCQGGAETINHVLFHCPAALSIWSRVGLPTPAIYLHQSLETNMASTFNIMEDKARPHTLIRAIPWVMWSIWKNRNSILYAETQVSMEKMIGDMTEEVEQWFLLNKSSHMDGTEGALRQCSTLWSPPEIGTSKCNIHANWRNANLHSGIAWIARDHRGNVTHHARDAIVHAPNRFIAELRCVITTMTSMVDLGVTKAVIASDYNEVIEAIKSPAQWPRYRALLQQITTLKEKFDTIAFEGEGTATNEIARAIAKSVLRDGRFQSYLALGGPSWLQDMIIRESRRSNV